MLGMVDLRQVLDGEVSAFMSRAPGSRVVHRGEWDAVIASPGPPHKGAPHWLHFLLTVCTCGAWLLVWVYVALRSSDEARRAAGAAFYTRLSVDAYGRVHAQPLGVHAAPV